MIFEARRLSRRWITVTLCANLVRKIASSSAESPPPTTAISWPRKKKPSHVAHVETPCPINGSSCSSPSISARAPVDTMTARARYSSAPTHTPKGRAERSTLVTLAVRYSAPKRSAWARNEPISSGPITPSMNPG